MSCSDIRRTFISRFSANGKSFSRLRKFFCSGAPALPPNTVPEELLLRPALPSAQGEPHQSKNLRGSGYGGDRSAHALRSWRKLIQPVRHVSTMAHARAQKKHRRSAAHVTAPSLEQRPSLFAGKRQRGPRDRISFRAMIFSARPPCSERHRPVPVPPGLPPNSSSSRARPDVVLKKRATMRFQPIPF